ncbi:MAG TPA: TIGR02281 family clan AA aspartic protease [Usitatibacteraceae bacterium]|nr:TIGR02281 family clan AA aspartic protease [Usitatibacteraceae bacterium]
MGVALAMALPAAATEVNVIGLFPGKAVVVIGRGAPRTLSAGQRTPEGVLLIAADSRSATLEIDGKREVLELGQHVESAALTGALQSVTLAEDGNGHFTAEGQVNGGRVRFLVDTGATLVTLPAAEAQRLGIDYRRGRQTVSQTANGNVVVYRVRLDSVALGPMTITAVDAVVHESPGLDIALLGMSFLNRTEMRREGANLTLTKRY